MASFASLTSAKWEKNSVAMIAAFVSCYNKIKIHNPSKLHAHNSATLQAG